MRAALKAAQEAQHDAEQQQQKTQARLAKTEAQLEQTESDVKQLLADVEEERQAHTATRQQLDEVKTNLETELDAARAAGAQVANEQQDKQSETRERQLIGEQQKLRDSLQQPGLAS